MKTFLVIALLVFLVWLVVRIVRKRRSVAKARRTVEQVKPYIDELRPAPRTAPIQASAPRYTAPVVSKEGGSVTKPTTSKPKAAKRDTDAEVEGTYVSDAYWSDPAERATYEAPSTPTVYDSPVRESYSAPSSYESPSTSDSPSSSSPTSSD